MTDQDSTAKSLAPATISKFPDVLAHFFKLQVFPHEHATLTELRTEIEKLPRAIMSSSPDETQFFQWLARLLGWKKCLEIGVFRGYTTLALALALPEDGRVVGLDITDEFPKTAYPFWEKAGVRDKIDIRFGPALDTLKTMGGEANSYDFAYIDADKSNYWAYFEECLKLVKVGGVIAVDNVAWHGHILDPAVVDADTQAIREVNSRLVEDHRVDIITLLIADGVTFCRRLA